MIGLPHFEPVSATVDEHQLELRVSGKDRLAALLSLINEAQSSLRLFFYIFGADETARRVRDALIAARDRGVKVWLLIDGFGSAGHPEAFYEDLVSAGIVFERFYPRWGRNYLMRNHQKMVIADERKALIGGANVDDHYFADDPKGESWHDLYLSIEGPAVIRLARYFDLLRRWMFSERPGLRGLIRILGRRSDQGGKLRWLMGGPFRRLSPLTRAIKADLERARQLDLVQAYFAPNWGMLRRLVGVERRGGEIRLITAARSDNTTTIAAARHCYRRVLRGGVEVYEYLAQKLHMKLIVVDAVTYIGSANFDMRSLFINAEIMLRIEDADFANAMRQFVTAHVPHCGRVTAESHRSNSTGWRRLKWLLSYFAVSTLDFTVTRRNLRRR